ncbi:hypothetical protein [Sphingomonas sp.]|uniref:hypothetical protein n=1 Tax=Sphingomonas sp. TaxID=28214 RepID=UPI002FD8C4D2
MGEMQWQPIEQAPTDGSPFIAAIEVHNLSGQRWWEMHMVWIDDETGDIHQDAECGWSLSDYSHFHPAPEPPYALLSHREGEG